MKINGKQEALLWISGLFLSFWVYKHLDHHARMYLRHTLPPEGWVNTPLWIGALQGSLEYKLSVIFQIAIPVIIVTGLLFMSFRARGK